MNLHEGEVFKIESILDDFDENSEKIYTDFDFLQDDSNDYSDPQFKQGQKVGAYSFAPISQPRWAKGVDLAVNTIVDDYPYLTENYTNYPYILGNISAAYIPDSNDIRPRLFDKSAKLWLLIDT